MPLSCCFTNSLFFFSQRNRKNPWTIKPLNECAAKNPTRYENRTPKKHVETTITQTRIKNRKQLILTMALPPSKMESLGKTQETRGRRTNKAEKCGRDGLNWPCERRWGSEAVSENDSKRGDVTVTVGPTTAFRGRMSNSCQSNGWWQNRNRFGTAIDFFPFRWCAFRIPNSPFAGEVYPFYSNQTFLERSCTAWSGRSVARLMKLESEIKQCS